MAAKDANDNWLLNFSVCVFEKHSKAILSGKAEFKCAIMEIVLQSSDCKEPILSSLL